MPPPASTARGDRADAEHRVGQRGETGDAGDQPRPAGQPAERVVRHRPQLPAICTVQHLGLVLSHVDARGAVRRARLAGQAQVEGVVHLGRGPAAGDERAVRHLLQHPRAPAGGVLLVLRRQVRRAHEPAGRGAVRPALADADAAVQRGRQVAGVVREREAVTVGQQRAGPRAAQVGVQRARADEHAGVEQVARVEEVLERAEQVDRLRRVHDREQLGAGATVAVLPGQRAAVRRDERRGVGHERAQRGAGALQRDVEAQVDAPVAEVPVREPVHPVRRHERLELAQVRAQPLGRHRRVLEPGPRLLARRRPPAEAGAVLADPPHRGGLRTGREEADGGGRRRRRRARAPGRGPRPGVARRPRP